MKPLTLSEVRNLLPSREGGGPYRPMSYQLGEPCERCWLECGRVRPVGYTVTDGQRTAVRCRHGGDRS